MKTLFNGDIVDINDAPCNEAGWLLGAGVFETIKTVNSSPYALGRHLQRAVISAQILGMPFPTQDLIESSVKILLNSQPHLNGLLRISFDVNGQWLAIHLPYQPLTTSAKIRIHPDLLISYGASIKSYPYDHRLAILKEAELLGFDEAIVCSTEGNICEGAVTNIMAQIDGRWVTPPTSDGVLPGIMRGLVIDNCGVEITSIPSFRIGDITSAFLLSSLRIAQPVASIDGRQLQASQDFHTEIHAMAIRNSVG